MCPLLSTSFAEQTDHPSFSEQSKHALLEGCASTCPWGLCRPLSLAGLWALDELDVLLWSGKPSLDAMSWPKLHAR